MSSSSPIRIAVDAVGGDHAPAAVLEGVTAALAADPGLEVLLVGPADVVSAYASAHERVEAVVASEIIGMDEHPAAAIRAKKNSSIVVGCRLVKDGRAHGFFSAGSTGAMMAGATLVMGRIKGVSRPAIATVIPTVDLPVVLLDIGANADCKPEHLVQFAVMGAAYARTVLGVPVPRVALLNIGEEATKGSVLAQEAHALMAAQVPGFIGNVEGRDIPAGGADVIVTDGFTGNVALKLMEGMSKALLGQFKAAMLSSPVNKVAAAVLKPSLQSMRDRLDPDSHGAAPLLGVAGLALIGHGSSGPKAVASALRVGATAVRGGLVERIAEALES
ncbi:MAG: phosphate acyltransferase PlsX [Coriobacteriia bacterium]|nr:phosphate acyltransferase PlsX [Coriobacteriia bacterium]